MITVRDIRAAIQDLPDSAYVLVNPSDREHWGWNERAISKATGAHDGRFGSILLLKIDGYVKPYGG